MTQKHFIQLADALRAVKPKYIESIPEAANQLRISQWMFDVGAVADMCAAANPRFNRQHWVDYIDGKVPAKGRRPK